MIRFFAPKTPESENTWKKVKKGELVTFSGKITELAKHPVKPLGVGFGGNFNITRLRVVYVNNGTSQQYFGEWIGKWDSHITDADVVLRVYPKGDNILAELQPSKDVSFAFVDKAVTFKAKTNTSFKETELKNGLMTIKGNPGSYTLQVVDEGIARLKFDFTQRSIFALPGTVTLRTGYATLRKSKPEPKE